MMTNIDLQKFCAKDPDPREQLYSPWRADGAIYATNGHVILCIDDDGRALPETTSKHPANASQICQVPDALTWKTITPEDCQRCLNTGRVHDEKCAICSGLGEFEYGSHWYHCKECDSAGIVSGPCSHCMHDGQIAFGLKIAHRYIRLISELPNPSFGFQPDEDKKAWFRFAGGHGVVMALRS